MQLLPYNYFPLRYVHVFIHHMPFRDKEEELKRHLDLDKNFFISENFMYIYIYVCICIYLYGTMVLRYQILGVRLVKDSQVRFRGYVVCKVILLRGCLS